MRGVPPPQGEGCSLRLPVPKGGGYVPLPLGGGVECWYYGQILPVSFVNVHEAETRHRDNCLIIKIAIYIYM
jgi:hypothetical protein